MSLIKVGISYGELLDKLTILEIKLAKIKDEEKLGNIRYEYDLLRHTWERAGKDPARIEQLLARLKAVNEQLWGIEDDIRMKEAASEFDAQFIELARSVYVTNDERARLKKEINLALGSALVEEKSYEEY